MTEQLQAMLASRKQLTDAIAHELRTPLVRLRYRLAMLDPAPSEEQQGLERDLGALDALIEEMLTYARLDRPELPLQCSELELGSWAGSRLADWQALRWTSGSTSCARPWPCLGAAIRACWIGRWRTSSATPCATPPTG